MMTPARSAATSPESASVAQPLIILGASARAAAQSARRGGFEPWCVDLFADRDLRAIAAAQRCPAGEYPHAMLELLVAAPADAPVLMTGAMENHLDVVRAVAEQRRLVTSSPDAMAAVRQPEALASMAPFAGLRFCRVVRGRWAGWRPRLWVEHLAGQRYLVKHQRSSGGRGVRFWSWRTRLRDRDYLQQFITGTPISAVYHTDGWSARMLGATEQIIGDAELGATQPFQYLGNLAPQPLAPGQRGALEHLGIALAQRHDLRGLFGVDAVIDKAGDIWPVEVNPRYTASVELVERALGVRALAPQQKAEHDDAEKPQVVHGKLIAFARDACHAGDLYEWFAREEVADVPDPGAAIAAGHPICTLFAQAPDRDSCRARLHQMLTSLYTRLHDA